MFAIDYDQLCWNTPDGFSLENIRLRVPLGSFFGLVGPQGSGRSALLRLTMGLLRPCSGTVTVLGSDSVMGSNQIRRQCTYAPSELSAEAAYDTPLRVREFLSGSMAARGKVDHSRIGELCQRFQLDGQARLADLDESERKRLILAMALLPEAALIVLDEPSLFLSKPERQVVFSELLRHHENGATVFFTTRSISEVRRYTTHCAIMVNGQILCGGETASMDILHARRVTVSVAEGVRVLVDTLGLHNYTSADSAISFFFTGDIDRLVKTLSQFQVLSLRIEEPALESALAAYHIMGGSEHAQTV